jgi:acyl-CoA dehydrogenase
VWDFETDPEYAQQLEWAEQVVRDEIQLLDQIIDDGHDLQDPVRNELIPPLQQRVKERGLWACHLGPELGGPGYGQVKLALLNEILGRSDLAPLVFGCAAPDTGNAEILAHFGSPELKERYLAPLLAGELFSCFSMTEPQGGSDPSVFTATAVLDGDEWVINGDKWFSSNARWSSFLVVMVKTELDAPTHQQFSMFVVPTDTPGVKILRNVGIPGWHRNEARTATHGYVRYEDVRIPADHLLGERGGGFVVAQTRLGGGRIHHAMRTVGLVKRALKMMLERAVSRQTQGTLLSDKQLVQQMISDTWIELEQFRLLVLRTAWRIDRLQDYRQVRGEISAVKATMPKVMQNAASRAIQIHGSLGLSDEMPIVKMLLNGFHVALADGPTEVHQVTLARELLKKATPSPGLFPTEHVPTRRAQAQERYREVLERHGRPTTVEYD